jgi:hypothetical protein
LGFPRPGISERPDIPYYAKRLRHLLQILQVNPVRVEISDNSVPSSLRRMTAARFAKRSSILPELATH